MSTEKCNSPNQSDSLLPRHVAIIMDGNGRWAEKRRQRRISGHKAGVDTARRIIQACAEKGIKTLTLFAFSSENWRRPEGEVGLLMDLFLTTIGREISKLHDNDIRLIFIGDIAAFNENLKKRMSDAEQMTKNNSGLTLVIAANYGGRWEITQSIKQIAQQVLTKQLTPDQITVDAVSKMLLKSSVTEPDLFIRTGGEQRISNFMLWQLAYTELYFTAIQWPDFDEAEFDIALQDYSNRQRRFGRTGKQAEQLSSA